MSLQQANHITREELMEYKSLARLCGIQIARSKARTTKNKGVNQKDRRKRMREELFGRNLPKSVENGANQPEAAR